MTKRAFAEVSGQHFEQQTSKRKEGHTIYGADGMERDEVNVEKNGCTAFLNEGDTETHAEVDSTRKIAEASAIGSFSSQKEFSSSDTVHNREDDTLADSCRSCPERSIDFSATRPYLIINGEIASQSYLNDGPSIKSFVADNDMVDRTSNDPSCSVEGVRQHEIDSMPLPSEFGNVEKTYKKKTRATVSERMNCTMHAENSSERSFSSAISIEINQKVPYANFKGELSLPPSPITGVINCFVSKPNGDSKHLDSLNEEDTAFSFQTPNRSFSKEIPKNEIGFEIQAALERIVESYDRTQNLTEHPSEVIHGDGITQQNERTAFSATLEDNPLSEEKNKVVQEIGSIPLERSLTYRTRKKLIVLDLNGLLCDIVNDFSNSYRVVKKIGGKPFFKRPFCDEFLKFCFDHFHIGIWSSRRKYNVESALDYLMGEFKHKLLFCWDQSKCTYTGARTIENHHKPLVLKELKKLWNKEESDLPWEKGDFSPSNTLLLDDSPYKALCNPPHTGIFPYPYQYTDERDNSLGPGGDIWAYLEQLVSSDDVQRFVEEHPFGQPAITASDQHWYFYCQIIRSNSTQLS